MLQQEEDRDKVRDQSGSRRVTLFDCFGPAGGHLSTSQGQRPPSATTCTWVPAQVSDQSGSRRVTLFDCFGPACRCCRPSLHLDPRSPLQPGLPLRGAAHPRAATPLEPRPHKPPDRRPSLAKGSRSHQSHRRGAAHPREPHPRPHRPPDRLPSLAD